MANPLIAWIGNHPNDYINGAAWRQAKTYNKVPAMRVRQIYASTSQSLVQIQQQCHQAITNSWKYLNQRIKQQQNHKDSKNTAAADLNQHAEALLKQLRNSSQSPIFATINQSSFLLYYGFLAIFATFNLSIQMLAAGLSKTTALSIGIIGTATALFSEIFDMIRVCDPKLGKKPAQRDQHLSASSMLASLPILLGLAGYDVFNRNRNMVLVQITTLKTKNLISAAGSSIALTVYTNGLIYMGVIGIISTYCKNSLIFFYEKLLANEPYRASSTHNTSELVDTDSSANTKPAPSTLTYCLLTYLAYPVLTIPGVIVGSALYGIGDSMTMYGIMQLLKQRNIMHTPEFLIGTLSKSYFVLSVVQRMTLWGLNFNQYTQSTKKQYHEPVESAVPLPTTTIANKITPRNQTGNNSKPTLAALLWYCMTYHEKYLSTDRKQQQQRKVIEAHLASQQQSVIGLIAEYTLNAFYTKFIDTLRLPWGYLTNGCKSISAKMPHSRQLISKAEHNFFLEQINTSASTRQYLTYGRLLTNCLLNITGTLLHIQGLGAVLGVVTSIAYLTAEYMQTSIQIDTADDLGSKPKETHPTQQPSQWYKTGIQSLFQQQQGLSGLMLKARAAGALQSRQLAAKASKALTALTQSAYHQVGRLSHTRAQPIR